MIDRHGFSRSRLALGAGIALAAALVAASALAQDAPPARMPPPDAVITPDAQAVLDRMSAALARLDRFEVTAQVTRDEVLPYGYKLQNNETARMLVVRPDKMRVTVAGDIKDREYVYDGKQVVVSAPDDDVYTRTPAPANLGALTRTLLDAGIELPLIDLLYHGNAGNLTDDVRTGVLVGDSEVDGVATDHLAFRQAEVDWQLWVAKGTDALPRKLVITTRYAVGDPQYQAVLKWDLRPHVHAKSFEFIPDKDAVEIPPNVAVAVAKAAEATP